VEVRRVSWAGDVLQSSVLDIDQRKALDGGPGHIELDAAFECCDGTNRDRDLPPTPQMPLLKEYMGHKMRQTFDDEPLDRSYFAIRRMHAIASVNPDLTRGSASWVTARAVSSAARAAARPRP